MDALFEAGKLAPVIEGPYRLDDVRRAFRRFFFLASIILSGFMFPFRGIPDWAQAIGALLPLTHFVVLVRGIVLKGNTLGELWPGVRPILVFMLVVISIGLRFYKRTLD